MRASLCPLRQTSSVSGRRRNRAAAAKQQLPALLRSTAAPSSPQQSRVAAPIARSRGAALHVMALDAAQPFDFEHKARTQLSKDKQLKIGIVGFGTFGQFLARRFVQAGHRVLATSRTPYHDEARSIGVQFYTDVDDFAEEHPDVVVLATSILSTEAVLRSLPLTRLKRSTLVVDVLSVKVFPKQLLLSLLPPQLDVLCTHPMFGPDSGKGSWEGLNMMYDAVRVGRDPRRQARLELFLGFFRSQGCRMVEMTCEEHDRQAASTQFVTHTVGRMLGAMELTSTDINTRGYEALLQLVANTTHDSFDLYYGLFLYNTNATEELERLEKAFDTVKKQLLGRLHDIARAQLFPVQPASSGDGLGGAPGADTGVRHATGAAAAAAASVAATLGSTNGSSSNGGSSKAKLRDARAPSPPAADAPALQGQEGANHS